MQIGRSVNYDGRFCPLRNCNYSDLKRLIEYQCNSFFSKYLSAQIFEGRTPACFRGKINLIQ